MKIKGFDYELPEYYGEFEKVLLERLTPEKLEKAGRTKEEFLEYTRALFALTLEAEKYLKERKN